MNQSWNRIKWISLCVCLFLMGIFPAFAGEDVSQAQLLAMLKEQAAEIQKLKEEVARLQSPQSTPSANSNSPLANMRPEDLTALVTEKVREETRAQRESRTMDAISQSLFGLEFHGSITQAYAVSGDNNYLSIDTEGGSFALMDATFNISKQMTDKLRGGMQIYIRKFGEEQDHAFEIDWATLDFHWRDWLGIRAGRVKTTLGLYTDSQDLDMVHTWAFAPGAIYDPASRGATISHDGVDIYGSIPLWRAGMLNYTAYIGSTSLPDYDGYLASTRYTGMDTDNAEVPFLGGFDLNFQPEGLLTGLKIGASYAAFTYDIDASGDMTPEAMQSFLGTQTGYAEINMESSEHNGPSNISTAYMEYQRDRFKFMAEYRRQYIDAIVTENFRSMNAELSRRDEEDTRGWYVGGSYRLNERWELGSYYSSFIADSGADHSDPGNYQHDLALTVRFDMNPYWYIKVEDHIMRGWGISRNYDNADREEQWNLFVIKTGLSF